MDKVIRDGKVAVIYSPGFGAGWYTWNKDYPQIIFHPLLVDMIEGGKSKDITSNWVLENLGIRIFCGGEELCIEWLPKETMFYIDEYDGAETVITDKGMFIA